MQEPAHGQATNLVTGGAFRVENPNSDLEAGITSQGRSSDVRAASNSPRQVCTAPEEIQCLQISL